MRVRSLLVLSAVLVLSACVATAPASARSTTGEQVCASYGGAYSTKARSSFFRPFTKRQKVLWTCNSYNGGPVTTQALVQSCANDGGQAANTLDGPPGLATCWKNAPV